MTQVPFEIIWQHNPLASLSGRIMSETSGGNLTTLPLRKSSQTFSRSFKTSDLNASSRWATRRFDAQFKNKTGKNKFRRISVSRNWFIRIDFWETPRVDITEPQQNSSWIIAELLRLLHLLQTCISQIFLVRRMHKHIMQNVLLEIGLFTLAIQSMNEQNRAINHD